MKKIKTTILFLALLQTFSAVAQSSKIKNLENQREQIKKEIIEINNLLSSNKKEKNLTFRDLEILAAKINIKERLIKINNDQINLLNADIKSNEIKSEELKLENENVRKDYASMIFNSYKSRLKESRIMFLLSSSTFLEAFKRSQYFSQFSDDRKKYSNKILKNLTSLDSINKILKDKIVDKEDLIKSNNAEKRDLSNERNNKNNALSSLKRKENAYKRQINQKQRQADLLDKEIDKLIKEAIRLSNENKKSSTFSLTPEAKALAESFTKNKGNLPWPVERGAIIQKFGLQPHPVVRTTKIKSNGIVIATTKDANVRSVFEGVVLSILKFKGSNLTVLIKHGNYISAYKNLSKVFVEKGDNINALQIIGEAYTNINDNKTTLQFSIFNNTTPLDPYLWIAK
ncbi:MAG: peptidase M23 [Flavobacteriaceae bacterium]|nr:peptidase M23 [Flavobacteriaceae bacterium]